MKSQKLLLVASVFCFCIAAVVFVIWYSEQAYTETKVVIPIYILVICCMGVVAYGGKRWLSERYPETSVWLHPPLFITLWWMSAYIIPGMIRFITLGNISFNEYMISINPIYTILGTILTLVGLLCLWMGYVFGLFIWRPILFLKHMGKQEITLGSALPFYFIAIFAQLIQISRVGIDYGRQTAPLGATTTLAQGLGYFLNISLLVFSIAVGQTIIGKWPRALLLIMAFLNIALGFMSGFMKPIFWLGLIFILVVLNTRKRLNRFFIPILLLLVVGVFVVPIAEDIRNQVDTQQYIMGNLSANVDTTVQVVVETSRTGLGSVMNLVVDRFLYRQALVAYTPGIIMQRTPSDFAYQGIGRLLLFPTYIIPRGLWPGKPNLSNGNWFTINYLNQPEFTASSAAITVFGEGYIYSGWLGTIIVCFILGCLSAFFYKNLAATGLTPVFILLLLQLIDVEGQFTGLFVASIQSSVVYLGVYFLMVIFSNRVRSARSVTDIPPY